MTALPADATPACADHPADLWFPPNGGDHQIRDAVTICATCPVRTTCRDRWARQPHTIRDRGVVAGGWYWPEGSPFVRPFPGDEWVIPGVTETVTGPAGSVRLVIAWAAS